MSLEHIPREHLEEFAAAARRSLETRFRYGFVKTTNPSSTTNRIAPSTPCRNIAAGAKRNSLPGLVMAAFECRQAKIRGAFARHGVRYLRALLGLGFDLTPERKEEIQRGKDFVQLKCGPVDLDLIFAPDGIERFEDAWTRHVDVEGFPVCHPDDIIASKAAANRAKDLATLPRLRDFRDYWIARRKN